MSGRTVLERAPAPTARTETRTCEVCGTAVDRTTLLHYRRNQPGLSPLLVLMMPRCMPCGRRGCPSCLVAVEDRVEDVLVVRFSCGPCRARRT